KMARRIPGCGLSGPPRHPGAGGGGWEPSARMRAIRSQLRTPAKPEMDQFGPKTGRFNLGGPLGGISRRPAIRGKSSTRGWELWRDVIHRGDRPEVQSGDSTGDGSSCEMWPIGSEDQYSRRLAMS